MLASKEDILQAVQSETQEKVHCFIASTSLAKDLCELIGQYAESFTKKIVLENFDTYWIKPTLSQLCFTCGAKNVIYQHFNQYNVNAIDTICCRGHFEISLTIDINSTYVNSYTYVNSCHLDDLSWKRLATCNRDTSNLFFGITHHTDWNHVSYFMDNFETFWKN